MADGRGGPLGSISPVKQIEATAEKVTKPKAEIIDPVKHDPVKAPPSSIRKSVIAGLLIVLLTFFGAGVWAATAPLASAVTASGLLVVIGRHRTVQHYEGGIVKSIHVHEGDVVKAGDLLVSLDPTPARAMVDRLQSQLDVQLAIRDRLHAEMFGKEEIRFDQILMERKHLPGPSTVMDVQIKEFNERRKSLTGTVDVLEQRIEQLNSSIQGLQAQRASKLEQQGLIVERMDSLSGLLDKGLVRRAEILELKRASAELTGDIGEIDAEVARAGEQIGEARLQIIQTNQEFREKVVAQLAETETRIVDLKQQLIVAKDVLKRIDIIAPIGGVVQNVNVTTIGGVIGSREPLMEIAPKSDKLLVEAHVSPIDIDKVNIGQEAEVRFSALDLRTTPSIFGTVETISGDRIVEQGNRPPYYRVQIETTPAELKKLNGQKLQAGMPAEVLIKTRDRTLFNYLSKPLADAMSRGMREE